MKLLRLAKINRAILDNLFPEDIRLFQVSVNVLAHLRQKIRIG